VQGVTFVRIRKSSDVAEPASHVELAAAGGACTTLFVLYPVLMHKFSHSSVRWISEVFD